MKRALLLIVLFLLIFQFPISNFQFPIYALSELEKIEQELTELNKALQQSVDATKPLEKSLDKLEADLKQIQNSIRLIDADLLSKKRQILTQELELDEKLTILSEKVYQFYKRTVSYNPFFELLLGRGSFGARLREMAYRQSVANHNKQVITEIVLFVTELEQKKAALEADLQTLARLRKKTDEQAEFFRAEIKGAKAYQEELQGKIVQLTARQQQILAQRLSSLNLPTSLGAGPLFCTDDRKIDPGFSPAFALFTLGIPHRVGMNQYGAYGRAQASQSAEDILRAYFQDFDFAGGKEGESVVVNGTNEFGQTFSNETMNIEEYLKHVHEMPTSWPMEALKAQAIAARSYALAVRNLRPSQADQVIKKELNSGTWIEAVEKTKGKIMAQGGNPIKTWYSSTDGGYTFSSADVWGGATSWTKRTRDTTADVGSFGDLFSTAYDKDSPCFYAAQGWRNEYGKSAWFKTTEVADIVNTLLLTKADGSTSEHLYQTDKPNPAATDNWDEERVKQELRNRGINPYNNIADISVSADFGAGITTAVNISGDAGSSSFNGADFKNRFNLRALANIQIVGPLYNIERK